jgi:hypothetical protein
MTATHRNERPLSREIILLLVIKMFALSAIWYSFYREPVIPSMIDGMDPVQVTTAVLGHPVKEEAQSSEGLEQANFR